VSRIRQGKVEIKRPRTNNSRGADTDVESNKFKAPELPVVDAKPNFSDKSKPSLCVNGKVFQGTVGTYAGKFQFDGDCERGTFILIAGMSGKGKYARLGEYLSLETDSFRYMLKNEGNRFTGERVAKDGGAKDVVVLEIAANAYTKNDLLGVWKGTYRSSEGPPFVTTFHFRDDGTLTTTTPSGRGGRGKWSLQGDAVVISFSNGQSKSWKLARNQLSMKHEEAGYSESAQLEKQ
jgi:hypothetical protein